jgi:hypothetical protein
MSPLILAVLFIPTALAVIYGGRVLWKRRLWSAVRHALEANEHVLFETEVSRGWPRRIPLFKAFIGMCTVTDRRLIIAGGVDWGVITVESVAHSQILDVSMSSRLHLTSVRIATRERSLELLTNSRLSLTGWKAASLADALNQAMGAASVPR